MPHHFLAGLLVKGARAWPEHDQTIGVEGDVSFYVFPQENGRARLYLAYSRQQVRRLAGADPATRFLESFRLRCLPYSDELAAARPVGPCRSYPNEEAWLENPVEEGIVLIGDAAGYDDPTIGQGLSNAFHDVRLVSEVLVTSTGWSPEAFQPYVAARAERGRRQSINAHIVARTRLEFDDSGRARRERLPGLASTNPALAKLLQAALLGAHNVPADLFAPTVWCDAVS